MARIKLPQPGPLANYVHIMRQDKEKACGNSDNILCNTSAAMVTYALHCAGSNFREVYNGPRCPHNWPSSAGTMAYILDNFAQHAIKTQCDPSWKSLLHGTVALLLFHSIEGSKTHYFDIWAVDKCTLFPELFSRGTAKELWIWPLGNAPKLHAKKQHHSKKKVAMIF